jgi:hypothetical protein
MSHSHSYDQGFNHSHDDFGGHGHSHEILDGPGSYLSREMPLIEGRDWKDRAFTIGIGGYVFLYQYQYQHNLQKSKEKKKWILTKPKRQTCRVWKDSPNARIMSRPSRRV